MKDTILDLNDEEILSFKWFNQEMHEVSVNKDGITKINCIEQFMGDSSLFWLQVWRNDQIIARYNVKNIDQIIYY